MKRNIISFCAIALVGVSMGVLGLSNHSSNTKQANTATKVEKHKSQKQSHKKKANNEKASADNNKSTEETKKESQQNENVVSQQNNKNSVNTTQTQKQNTQVQQQKTQGQINKERGYDPNGHPLLPGQDHAAGSNPDGSADDWVKGQSEWLRQNELINSDGSPTQKAKDLQAQTAAEASNSDTNP